MNKNSFIKLSITDWLVLSILSFIGLCAVSIFLLMKVDKISRKWAKNCGPKIHWRYFVVFLELVGMFLAIVGCFFMIKTYSNGYWLFLVSICYMALSIIIGAFLKFKKNEDNSIPSILSKLKEARKKSYWLDRLLLLPEEYLNFFLYVAVPVVLGFSIALIMKFFVAIEISIFIHYIAIILLPSCACLWIFVPYIKDKNKNALALRRIIVFCVISGYYIYDSLSKFYRLLNSSSVQVFWDYYLNTAIILLISFEMAVTAIYNDYKSFKRKNRRAPNRTWNKHESIQI